MRPSSVRLGTYFLASLLGSLPAVTGRASWSDTPTGLPPITIVSAKELGDDSYKSLVVQDRFGRLFIGSSRLLVFDGQAWKSFPKDDDYQLTALTLTSDGIIWAGTTNSIGYFQEEPVGEFKFHSLQDKLPADARDLGTVFCCAPIGPYVYFVGRDKLLRWDGKQFRVTRFQTDLRLAAAKVGDGYWLQHPETGLYRLTENGPELQFTANKLPPHFLIGLLRDSDGMLLIGNDGFCRPGSPPFSPKALNDYLAENRVSAVGELPDGNIAISTIKGGIVITTHRGEIVRLLADASTGLPGRAISRLSADSTGTLFGVSPADFFYFRADGHASVFNALNGLRSQSVTSLAMVKGTPFVTTADGVYRQMVSAPGDSTFQQVPVLASTYNYAISHADGLLLGGFGGVDWFDGHSVHHAYEISAATSYLIVAARTDPNVFYVAESKNGLVRLFHKPDGTFERAPLCKLPDSVTDLHEDAFGRLWMGTPTQGAFTYDFSTQELAQVKDPANGKPLTGHVEIAADPKRILLFNAGRVLRVEPKSGELRPLAGIPAMSPSISRPVPGGHDIWIAYRRPPGGKGPLHGAGVLSFAADESASWRELDLPSLNTIGSIGSAAFSMEHSRPILWLGGIGGVLQLDYDAITNLPPPTAPIIKLAGTPPRATPSNAPAEYPFSGHQLAFRVFTDNFFKSKDWLVQSRLNENEPWSPPSSSRAFDYTNLSEGAYQFEVRTVNTAGVASTPVSYAFRILPPWYRSKGAYAGYTVSLLLAVFGFIRIRERRIKARNEELEGLVNIRTAELVKANAAKDEFLAGISHEIRNPMNGVIGIAENFRTDALDLESRRKFGLLRQCASHLSSLLEDILDFSKVQAGAIELDPKPFDLPELVESVAGITRADSEKYGIPVEVAVSPAVPRKLVGDARRIRQILINFVSNALKFSGRGQVSVTVWCKDVGPGQTEVIFAISDEGPGISPEEQARLFTRFERGAAAQKGRVPGTGLGLALCKGLAEKMGGKIWLESELGRGSCFYFSAPFPVVETAADSAASPTPATAGTGRTALVVDDQEYNRIVLVDLLQSMGFTVHATQEG
ncbi:MAG TPA: ATP-binding protein, partial [Lacunisphaera sp.]